MEAREQRLAMKSNRVRVLRCPGADRSPEGSSGGDGLYGPRPGWKAAAQTRSHGEIPDTSVRVVPMSKPGRPRLPFRRLLLHLTNGHSTPHARPTPFARRSNPTRRPGIRPRMSDPRQHADRPWIRAGPPDPLPTGGGHTHHASRTKSLAASFPRGDAWCLVAPSKPARLAVLPTVCYGWRLLDGSVTGAQYRATRIAESRGNPYLQ